MILTGHLILIPIVGLNFSLLVKFRVHSYVRPKGFCHTFKDLELNDSACTSDVDREGTFSMVFIVNGGETGPSVQLLSF